MFSWEGVKHACLLLTFTDTLCLFVLIKNQQQIELEGKFGKSKKEILLMFD